MNWLRRLFSRQEIYGDLSDEIQQHLAEKTETLVGEGMSREEAEYADDRPHNHQRGGQVVFDEVRHDLSQVTSNDPVERPATTAIAHRRAHGPMRGRCAHGDSRTAPTCC